MAEAETIEEKIAKQAETVKNLEESSEKNSRDDMKPELLRERDKLRHLKNTQTGNAKDRAQKAAEFARQTALGKAIEQVPPEPAG
jgi:predicted aminopeptidase